MQKDFDPEIGRATRWQKGQPSPNPGGRPRKTLLTSAYVAVLAEPYPGDRQGRTYAEVIAQRIAIAAARGDLGAASELADRTEGKPRKENSDSRRHLNTPTERLSGEELHQQAREITARLRMRLAERNRQAALCAGRDAPENAEVNSR